MFKRCGLCYITRTFQALWLVEGNQLWCKSTCSILIFKLTEKLDGMKIGLLKEGFIGKQQEVDNMVRNAIYLLKDAGATVEEVSVPLHHVGKFYDNGPTWALKLKVDWVSYICKIHIHIYIVWPTSNYLECKERYLIKSFCSFVFSILNYLWISTEIIESFPNSKTVCIRDEYVLSNVLQMVAILIWLRSSSQNQGCKYIFGMVNTRVILFMTENEMTPGRCSTIDVCILDVLMFYITLTLF